MVIMSIYRKRTLFLISYARSLLFQLRLRQNRREEVYCLSSALIYFIYLANSKMAWKFFLKWHTWHLFGNKDYGLLRNWGWEVLGNFWLASEIVCRSNEDSFITGLYPFLCYNVLLTPRRYIHMYVCMHTFIIR